VNGVELIPTAARKLVFLTYSYYLFIAYRGDHSVEQSELGDWCEGGEGPGYLHQNSSLRFMEIFYELKR
jgi:hypothetical protein